MKVGIIQSKHLKNYDFGPGHPFRGDRFKTFFSFFNTKFSKSNKFKILLNEKLASNSDLELWHTKDYIRAMKRASSGAEVADLFRYISSDNLNPHTRRFPVGIEPAARVIVKNSMLACELVLEGKFEKVVSIGGGDFITLNQVMGKVFACTMTWLFLLGIRLEGILWIEFWFWILMRMREMGPVRLSFLILE